ncbi:hypothetical protein PPL_11436 [Heterostelium album PN500]|uniref:Uncharacterized protein n=1 Tax=Heterostelium pallidum (strain ATCC 26659 / Pp 5 / PN500) TaxID=670386 RepID=D3BTE2_HETP5|nr:hypothetical protein PPL_11436 [Heterostelium album PN500]EFA75359.1 hypothetical protein PPL_11436 [Heterostelium album PN500]|eukprot:XP_020427493.1 hypothetical protein PPL_11436 [Heterostelium album PN500]
MATDFKSIIAQGSSQLLSILATGTSKQFLINRISNISWFDYFFFAYGLYESVGFLKDKPQPKTDIKGWMTYEESHQLLMDLLDDASAPKNEIDGTKLSSLYYSNERVQLFINLIQDIPEYRKLFQLPEIYNKVVYCIANIDELIREKSLQASQGKSIPLYAVYFYMDMHKCPTDILKLLNLRESLTRIFSFLTEDYKNAPIEVIRNVVSLGTNPKVTFGVRRMCTIILSRFALSKSNIQTIIDANGLPLIQFYVTCLYPGREDEISSINALASAAPYSSIPFNPVDNNQIITRRVLLGHKLRSLFFTLLSPATILLYNYKRSGNLNQSLATTGLYLIINNFYKYPTTRFVSLCLSLLYIPTWKENTMVYDIYDILQDKVHWVMLQGHNPVQYTENDFDRIIPSTDMMLNFNINKMKSKIRHNKEE